MYQELETMTYRQLRRELFVLQNQEAMYGIDVPPHIAIRIQDIEKEMKTERRIAELEQIRSEA